VPANAAVLLPDDVPTWRAVLGANMETALNAVWDAGTGPFGRIAVVGTGVVGALAGYLFGRLTNAEVWFIDIDESRTHVAHALGAHFALPHAAPRDCGLVVHASATAAGLATSLNLAAEEATVLELSWYGDTEVSVPLGGAFHSRRLKLVSSQVGKVAPSHRATYSHRRRLEAALSMLDDPRLDVLIAPAVRFEELPSRLPRVLAPDSGVLCQRIDYD
jgi:threonine dehydrogenase-like Zn-dependent dehydrogenase